MEQFLNEWHLRLCRDVSEQSNAATNHRPTDAGKRRVAEAAVRIETCITNWINPFQADDKLCHLASARNATSDISAELST